MERQSRPVFVTVAGVYAIALGVLRAISAPYCLIRMNSLLDLIGKYPSGWTLTAVLTLVTGVFFLGQVVAGVAIMKGRNWGRFLLASTVPAIAFLTHAPYRLRLPGLEWDGLAVDFIFVVFLFLPMSSAYFCRRPALNSIDTGKAPTGG